jgi:hypothetical protein
LSAAKSSNEISHGSLLSRLESTTDSAASEALHEEIKEVNEKMAFFHVLNNAISTVDTVLHTEKMIEEFKPSSNASES